MSTGGIIVSWIFVAIYLLLIVIFGISLVMAIFLKVPFVPTKKSLIKKLIEIAELKSGQIIMDLGCGDGRLLIYAKQHHDITAIGYEMSPVPYYLALIRRFFTKTKFEIRCKNFFKSNLDEANVIFLYLIPDVLPKLGEKLLKECKKGTKIISHTFKIPTLTPVKTIEKDAQHPIIYIYEI
jgi:hypothetical protein